MSNPAIAKKSAGYRMNRSMRSRCTSLSGSWDFAFFRRSQNEGAPLRAVFAEWVARLVSGTFVVRRMSDFVLETDTRTGILNVHPTHPLTPKRWAPSDLDPPREIKNKG